ncbi:MAG: SUMF1/EgtB/PvdO family nonheme iron enzyme [Planctomycetes bacterium]|nr:SUMF1/EgtB/PvdO family nonheme iron enzyme [Planctomycetota bacterium]MCB9889103.1 SUMF1/EgtB/PvdO family nonheme iron enzyme [Planctomycetota bacterium]
MTGPVERFWEGADGMPPDAAPPDAVRDLLEELDDLEAGEALLAELAGPAPHDLGRNRDLRLEREVAIVAARTADPAEERRHARATRLQAALCHPAIPAVYGIVAAEDGRPARTGPVARGEPLLARAGSMRLRDLLSACVTVCDALAHAHARGVCHGSLSADCIRIGRFGEVRVTDWERVSDDASLVQDDIAAFGRALTDCLVGRDAPPALAAVAAHASAGGYPGIEGVRADLVAFLEGRVVGAYRVGPAAELSAWIKRHRTACGLVVAALLLAAAGAWWSVASARSDRVAVAAAERLAQDSLADLRRLGDTWQLARLLIAERGMWPAVPDRAPAMREWIARATELCNRRALHTARLAGLAPDAAPGSAVDWERGVLVELLERATRVDGLVAVVRRRHDLAVGLREATTGGAAGDAWRRARVDVQSLPHYSGLRLEAQLGLVPLWRDAASGLWLFAHTATGAPPRRDPASGRAVITPATGIVLALLPGGDARLGSRAVSPIAPRGAPYVDEGRRANEGPLHRVRLRPFFVSCFEVTQAQWKRLRMTDRSRTRGALHPVEYASHDDASEFCRRADLELPTEAQWEYACRAGSTNVYWFGDDAADLARHDNVSSAELPAPTESWRDGFAFTAPVGSYLPNRFGLFDLHGNVREWCRDGLGSYGATAGEGDGVRDSTADERALRGGSWVRPAREARSASRGAAKRSFHDTDTGLRVARALRQ